MKKIIDGNEAAAYCAYAFSEFASLFPITPSTKMSELMEKWSAAEKKNCFGQPVRTLQMESENGTAGVMHGVLQGGSLATTFTCSQGLLLMIPTLYKMAGELLPGVIHVSARSLATSALSIYGDHSDVMAVRQTGAIILSSSSVQTAALYSAVAHLAAIRFRLPVIHFFDGFHTSHEIRNVTLPTYHQLKKQINTAALESFKANGLSNFDPKAFGTSQMPDLFFQQREVSNSIYQSALDGIEEIVQSLNLLFDSYSSCVEYYGNPDAEKVIVLMGSAASTAQEVVEHLSANEAVGVITIHLYRPFPEKQFLQRLPETVKEIFVMDRTKEPGGTGEPLLLDIQRIITANRYDVQVKGCRYGIGGKDVTADQIAAVFHEMPNWSQSQSAVVGIQDDLTDLSLDVNKSFSYSKEEQVEMILLGAGADGMVTGTKDVAKIIDHFMDVEVQARFEFSPIKSRHVTQSFLRLSKSPILSAYNCTSADLMVLAQPSYLKYEELLKKLKPNSKLLINFDGSIANLAKYCSTKTISRLSDKNVQVYCVPASTLARTYQLGPKTSCLMVTALLTINDQLPLKEAISYYKSSLKKAEFMSDSEYQAAVFKAIDEVPAFIYSDKISISWSKQKELTGTHSNERQKQITDVCGAFKGNEVSTKTLADHQLENGAFPLMKSSYQISLDLEKAPCWKSENCLKCNLCSVVCPHSAIQPKIVEKPSDGSKDYLTYGKDSFFNLDIDLNKCTGCMLCKEICPAKEKALVEVGKPNEKMKKENSIEATRMPKNKNSLTASQFTKPLLSASGACPGCGETPYLKLLTQLFGERLSIANATGCSSIWGASAPFVAYQKNDRGQGPVWSNPLFENNSSFGLGMKMSFQLNRDRCYQKLEMISDAENYPPAVRKICSKLVSEKGRNLQTIEEFLQITNGMVNESIIQLRNQKQYLLDRTQWIVGGDGWAYDIDFNGIDRLLSQNENVNILVLENGGYANTGGQVSGAAEENSSMKLASKGKQTIKKDLSFYALQYPDAYVAQVSLFAEPKQTYQAIVEAETHKGASIIIAYAHCDLHKTRFSGIEESKLATESGYWPLFRYDPNKQKRFRLDSCNFSESVLDQFLVSQPRFSLIKQDSTKREKLIATIKRRQRNYLLMAELFNQLEVRI